MNARSRRNPFVWFAQRPKTSGIVVFAVLSAIVSVIAIQRFELSKSNQQREMYQIVDAARNNLEQSIKSCYAASLSLALTIDDQGVPRNFDAVASKLLQSNNLIHTLELVPDGVIRYVYPTIGNERAIGFDIIHSPKHRTEALRSLKDGKMYFAGPLELRQGGVGIVGRMAVYRNNRFWGFSAVIIKPETLFEFAGLRSVDRSRFFFQLVKKDPVDAKTRYFLPESDAYKNTYYVSREIPDGGWTLVLASRNSRAIIWSVLPILLFGLCLAALMGLVITVVLEKPAAAIRESEARFENLFNNVPIALWEEDFSEVRNYLEHLNLMDRDADFLDGYFGKHNDKLKNCLSLVKIVNVNDECLKLHHPKTRAQLLTQGLDPLIGYDIRHDFIKQLEAVSRALPHVSMHTKMKIGSGQIRELFLEWTVVKGSEKTLDRVIVATEDVTDRLYSERLLSDSQQRIESLVNTIDGVVWESRFENNDIAYVNAKAEEITGYPIAQWLQEPNFWTNHIFPEDREQALRFYSEHVRKEQQFEFEYRFIKSDGSLMWARDYVSVVFENGQPTYVRGIMIDITNSKLADEKLNESLKLVIEQNKRLQNFSYIVSHNLRSHTSNIQSIAALMEHADSEAEKKQMTGMLRTVSSSLNETMTNLNEVVNIQNNISLVSEELNVRHYVESAIAVLSEQIAIKNADIVLEVPKNAKILFNAAYFESILHNLVSNAIRYSSADRQARISIAWNENHAVKSLEISDNGIGIDLKKYGDQLFGMYKTFSTNPDSRGIGLFITKNQIEAMGGTIGVESELGKGTKFVVRFK